MAVGGVEFGETQSVGGFNPRLPSTHSGVGRVLRAIHVNWRATPSATGGNPKRGKWAKGETAKTG